MKEPAGLLGWAPTAAPRSGVAARDNHTCKRSNRQRQHQHRLVLLHAAVPYASRARALGDLDADPEVGAAEVQAVVAEELSKLNDRLGHSGMSESERSGFSAMLSRYLIERKQRRQGKSRPLDWDHIQAPTNDDIVRYNDLQPCSPNTAQELLDKLVVLKLNGGLGTSMGCVGPKSAIEVRDEQTFMDLTVGQIATLNRDYGAHVPLLLMNSFNTHDDTEKMLSKYARADFDIIRFYQSRFPRVARDTLSLLSTEFYQRRQDSKKEGEGWYPPGHGDLWGSLRSSGLLDKLIADGKEYLFVSNIDNLGASVDLNILSYMDQAAVGFLSEVTDKTIADVKGGTLISNDSGRLELLEIAQVPKQHVEEFKSIRKFRVFNTNNMWVNLRRLKEVLETQHVRPELIVNRKSLSTGLGVIQLETAAGQLVQYFQDAKGLNVPRERFLPVKTTSDLFVVQSNLYTSEPSGHLKMNPRRQFGANPHVKLGEHYAKVENYSSRLGSIPDILELEHLTVSGDVAFGRDVTLRGTVIIVANGSSRIDIPSGAILENKVVSGDLQIVDH